MILRWSLLATNKQRNPDVVIVGTDPILSVLIAIVWRFFRPRTILVNWCFDLYPEAAFADGVLSRTSIVARLLQALLKKAYRACDLIVDIGPCMRKKLLLYDPSLRITTIVPWALEEPPSALPVPSGERTIVFGDSSFGVLYSGSFGRPHSYELILELARRLRADDVQVSFSVRGNRVTALRSAVDLEDLNISFVPFSESGTLSNRLACADVHLVSLREEWTGTVVPSKFFGALAIGRPVIFCGDRESSVAQWIEHYDLGWVLTRQNISEITASIRGLSKDASEIQKKREHCHAVYQACFSREISLQGWHKNLAELMVDREGLVVAPLGS
jgi:hypothetical protein